MRLKDQLKQLIASELVNKGLLKQSYVIGVVTAVNSDGTCSATANGTAITSTPLYPVVQGQEVMLMFGDRGKVSAVPTRPNTPRTQFEKPPFFSGGFKFRTVVLESNSNLFPALYYLRVQDSGSNSVYRLALPTPPDLFDGVTRVLIQNIAISPNGQHIAYTEGSQSSSGKTYNNRFRIYNIGPALQSSGVIPGSPNLFSLQATLFAEYFVGGIALADALYTSPPVGGTQPSPPGILYNRTNGIDLFLTNDPVLYCLETLEKQTFTTSLPGTPYPYNNITRNFISFQSGSRAVLGSTTQESSTASDNLFPSQNAVFIGSGIIPFGILDPSRGRALDSVNILGAGGGGVAGSPGPLNYDQLFSLISQIESSSPAGYVGVASGGASQGVSSTNKRNCRGYSNGASSTIGPPYSFVKFLVCNPTDGSLKDYQFVNPDSVFLHALGVMDFLTDGTSNGSALFVQANSPPNGVDVYKAVLDDTHSTITIGSLITVTPNPPDAGFTQNQLRLANLGTPQVGMLTLRISGR